MRHSHIVHETRYTYSSPVAPAAASHAAHASLAELRKPSTGQGEMTERRDYYGNPTLHTLIAVPHGRCSCARNRVSVKPARTGGAGGAAPRMGGGAR